MDDLAAKQINPAALAEWFASFRDRCEYTLNEACLLDVIADRERQLAEAQALLKSLQDAWQPHSELECTQLHADKVEHFNATVASWMKRAEAAEAKLRAVERRNETLDIDVGVLTERLAAVAALRDELGSRCRFTAALGGTEMDVASIEEPIWRKLDAILTGGTTP